MGRQTLFHLRGSGVRCNKQSIIYCNTTSFYSSPYIQACGLLCLQHLCLGRLGPSPWWRRNIGKFFNGRIFGCTDCENWQDLGWGNFWTHRIWKLANFCMHRMKKIYRGIFGSTECKNWQILGCGNFSTHRIWKLANLCMWDWCKWYQVPLLACSPEQFSKYISS